MQALAHVRAVAQMSPNSRFHQKTFWKQGPRGGWLAAALARLAGEESSPEACCQAVPNSRTRGVIKRPGSAFCVRASA